MQTVFCRREYQVTVTFIDHSAEGQDIGDYRISTGPLRTEDRPVIGESEAETVVVHIEGNGKARMTSIVILHLAGGAITYKTVSAPTVRAADDTTGPVNASGATRMIITGSDIVFLAPGARWKSRGKMAFYAASNCGNQSYNKPVIAYVCSVQRMADLNICHSGQGPYFKGKRS
ncbi:hypothetical protein [Ruegeria arenilitoris]|uniref:hypothetical protein n=1 Tax=Ruegeria arenilitoris TaxID=1173585 RepID=UPI001480E55B|nr:hypothetical protein [Ruegeria arenilitoris]